MSSAHGYLGKNIPGGGNSKFKDGNKPGSFISKEASGQSCMHEGGTGDEIREIRVSLGSALWGI